MLGWGTIGMGGHFLALVGPRLMGFLSGGGEPPQPGELRLGSAKRIFVVHGRDLVHSGHI